jgi:hypothetical protein
MKDYCNHCLEIYNELSAIDGATRIPKERMAALPGKRSNKPKSLMTPEEYEQHRIFMRAYSDLYKEINGEQIAEYQKQFHINYRKNHPEKLKAASAKRYKEDPEYYHNNARLRRAKELAAYREPYSTDDVLKAWGIMCHLCLEPVDLNAPRHVNSKESEGWQRGLHLDHVIPISQGGPDMLENVKPAHALCNIKRSREVVDLDNLPSKVSDKVLSLVNTTMLYGEVKKGRKKLPR